MDMLSERMGESPHLILAKTNSGQEKPDNWPFVEEKVIQVIFW